VFARDDMRAALDARGIGTVYRLLGRADRRGPIQPVDLPKYLRRPVRKCRAQTLKTCGIVLCFRSTAVRRSSYDTRRSACQIRAGLGQAMLENCGERRLRTHRTRWSENPQSRLQVEY
jgi:hypothetical protein